MNYRFAQAYESMKKLGVDDVYCLSVNDAFVMRQWGIHQGLEKEDTAEAGPLNPGNFKKVSLLFIKRQISIALKINTFLCMIKVKMLPDGAALFSRGMGMSVVWDSERGFGERSWRYSVVINDMKVEKIFVEGGSPKQNYGPDPFEVSDAKTMLTYLKSKK